MNPISDNELVCFYYRDGLSAQRIDEISRALEQDAELGRRYAALEITLQAADLDQPPEPDDQLAERLWQELSMRLAAEAKSSTETARSPAVGRSRGSGAASARASSRRRPRTRTWQRLAGGAIAALLLLGLGFFAGRQTPPAPQLALQVSADRVYQAALARHLSTTRRALLTATNGTSPSLDQGNAVLARSLLDNHRLYLAAAEHNGDRRLVQLLQEIEPVLIELANPSGASDVETRKGLSDFVEHTDLIFQVRAVEAGLNARRSTRT